MPKPFAKRLQRLGTETAYAVSAEAALHRQAGNRVFDFHIGDLNFSTPPHICQALKQAIDDGKTNYCPARGVRPLAETLARVIGEERGVVFEPDQVAIQPGGKPVIFKFIQCIMEEGDEILYPTPGYPIYESTINYFGGVTKPYIYKETPEGMVLDLEYLRAQITPKTKALIVNNYQNPIGHACSQAELEELARIAVENDLWVLSDEAYFHFYFGEEPPKSIVSLPGMLERTCILLTASKSYAMTGWRLGAAVGPKDLIANMVKITTNDEACTTHFVQYAAITAFSDPETQVVRKAMANQLKERRDLLWEEVNKVPGWHAPLPPSSFYMWVNVTEAFKILGLSEYEEFRRLLMVKTGIAFCTREHFGASLPFEEQKYIRLAYSGIQLDDIRAAMTILKDFMEKSQQEKAAAQ